VAFDWPDMISIANVYIVNHFTSGIITYS